MHTLVKLSTVQGDGDEFLTMAFLDEWVGNCGKHVVEQMKNIEGAKVLIRAHQQKSKSASSRP